ncbi:MAG: hypothetical protein EXR72_21475 [Myxococcales bacterium]|nr:hypothetical protein [Myxococcales bacterium]
MKTLRLACFASVLASGLASGLVACGGGGGGYRYFNLDGGTGDGGQMQKGDGAAIADAGMCGAVGMICGGELPGCCAPATCLEGMCVGPNTCKGVGTMCVQGDVCCMGLVCNGADNLCEACGMAGKKCNANIDCCNGFECTQDGICQKPVMCKQPGIACAKTAECCNGVCNQAKGACAACGIPGVQCAVMEDCCNGLLCQNGSCKEPVMCKMAGAFCAQTGECCQGQGLICHQLQGTCASCGVLNSLCKVSADCCNGVPCTNGVCKQPVMCKANGSVCALNADCCGALCNGFDKLCAACGATVNANCASNSDCCGNQNWTCNLNTHKCQMPMVMCKAGGLACVATVECCKGLYCDGGKCTAAPICKAIGATCAKYSDCCEGDSMECTNTKCCIHKTYQDVAMIKCYATAECCPGQTCNLATGACQ